MDVSILSDLMLSVANLVEMESHAQMSYFMTNDKKWLEIKGIIAKIRQRQQGDLEKEEDSQKHCFNKHNLSAFLRSWECGDKFWRNQNKEKAMKYYEESQKLIEIFYSNNFSEDKKSVIDKIKNGLKNEQEN